jgi:hypothetical protein
LGYTYDEGGHVVKDPNRDVQAAVDMFFRVFRMCGSAHKTVAHYHENGYKIPKDLSKGFGNKELLWVGLSTTRAINILHNPTYAGVYAYGQKQSVATMDGKKSLAKPVNEWHAYIPSHHEPYISEEEFKLNQDRLLMNCPEQSPVPPVREGSALLQGICLCGMCGRRMSVHYHCGKDGKNTPYYACGYQARNYGGKACQCIHGTGIDEAVSALVLERLTPAAIRDAVQVEEEIKQREASSGGHFVMRLERAQYEANLAKKRYMSVDPSNRLVAYELERIWNQRITELAQAEEDLRIREEAKRKEPPSPKASELMALPEVVRGLWGSDHVSMRDKKRVIRCVVEDVTVTKAGRSIQLGIRFKTGATTLAECQNPPMNYEKWATDEEVLNIIRRESASHTKKEIAEILEKEGCFSGKGLAMNIDRVRYIMSQYGIPSLKDHLKAKGFLTGSEKAAQLGIAKGTLCKLRREGMLECGCVKTSGKGDYMFAP